jgi:hypothetical protein
MPTYTPSALLLARHPSLTIEHRLLRQSGPGRFGGIPVSHRRRGVEGRRPGPAADYGRAVGCDCGVLGFGSEEGVCVAMGDGGISFCLWASG